ncbi:MAG: FHA domain-containing protein [Elainella sp. C42_A2020_010]|nr:FHA domain-containing protein [Elainella sp. C42_A2020_010]
MLKIRSVNFEQKDFQIHTLDQCYLGQVEWIIGRNITSDLVLVNPEVSRLHGRISYQDDIYYFADMGSTCGSILNGEKVAVDEKYPLKLGDLLQIGDVFLHIEELSPPFLAPAELEPVPQIIVLPQEHYWTSEELTVRCCRIVDETPDIKSFYFLADPPILFDYKPGQFVNLEAKINGKAVIRSYSISTSPTRPYYLGLTVKRVSHPTERPDLPVGFVSNWLHDSFGVGDSLKLIGGATGQFTCFPELHPKLLLISGGSGIAPMMSMARWIHDAMVDCDVVFLYSAQTPENIPFRAELETMAAQMPNFHLAVTITRPNSRNPWMGLTGRISKAMLHLVVPDLLERFVYVCGSEPFTQNIKGILESINFPMKNYREESFGSGLLSPEASKVSTGGSKDKALEKFTMMPPQAVDNSTVHFSQSNKKVTIDGHTSILELAEQVGVDIRHHCRMGACGVCKVFTCKGKVRYDLQPTALSQADQEAGYALACIACPVEGLTVEA